MEIDNPRRFLIVIAAALAIVAAAVYGGCAVLGADDPQADGSAQTTARPLAELDQAPQPAQDAIAAMDKQRRGRATTTSAGATKSQTEFDRDARYVAIFNDGKLTAMARGKHQWVSEGRCFRRRPATIAAEAAYNSLLPAAADGLTYTSQGRVLNWQIEAPADVESAAAVSGSVELDDRGRIATATVSSGPMKQTTRFAYPKTVARAPAPRPLCKD